MKIRKKLLSLALSGIMALGSLSGPGVTAFAEEGGLKRNYGEYEFSKISNPSSGSGEADGINTNDLTGYPANRLNSYAWAVASRGDSIYIGTNRTLFGSSLNAVVAMLQKSNPDISEEKVCKIIDLVTGGDVPVNLEDEEYIPQIIKFDVKNGCTSVIYQPNTMAGDDGSLYYTDRDGNILTASKVSSEIASFRSVIEYKGNLYFGSLGTNMLQLVRVDENDTADVVFQAVGQASSLRACCAYDDGDGETIYFGGFDGTYPQWRMDRMNNPEMTALPIVVRRLNPDTAGTANEDWSDLVADYRDFGKYASSKVYVSSGGNVWDLCNYNGRMYLILAYEGGWALFRGEKGGDSPNEFGWTWTEIVGDNGKYPLAMDSQVAELNEKYREEYGCGSFAATLTGTGLLESAATPYVFNGKMYIGSFDNATIIQSQTVMKAIAKLQAMKQDLPGPTLEQIFAPIYEVLTHPQHIWVMDENENIVPADGANALLDGTTNDYVWRFIDYNGKLYAGTFDSSTAYNYFVDFSLDRLVYILRQSGVEVPEILDQLKDGSFTEELKELLPKRQNGLFGRLFGHDQATDEQMEVTEAAVGASECVEECLNGESSLEELYEKIAALDELMGNIRAEGDSENLVGDTCDSESGKFTEITAEALEKIRKLLEAVDLEGLRYWIKAREVVRNAEHGFDLLVTEDSENWQKITGDGLEDRYNYGARTFTICDEELYLGTANPYYGAQLWSIGGEGARKSAFFVENPEAIEGLVYTGEPQQLVTEGQAEGGTIYYALGANGEEAPAFDGLSEDENKIWGTDVPKAVDVGEYCVWFMVAGDDVHRDTVPESVKAEIAIAEMEIVSSGYVGEYDGQEHGISVTVANAENAQVLYGTSYGVFDLESSPVYKDVGSHVVYYQITADNFEPVRGAENVAIVKARLSVAAEPKSKVYGEPDPELTYTVEGLVAGDELTGEIVREEGDNAGTYAITAGTLSASDNYDLNFTPALFTIKKASVDFTAPTANELTYNCSEQPLVEAGYAEEGTIYYSLDGENYSEEIPTGKDAGQYTVYYSYSLDENHVEVTDQLITVTILPKELVVTAYSADKEYGSADPTLNFDVSGLCPCDKFSGELSRETGENAGTYSILLGTVEAGDNYTVTYNGASFTIERKDISSASVSTKYKSYDYNGKNRMPNVMVELEGETLSKGTDFQVVYKDNQKMGTAFYSATGIGNYKGTVVGTFKLTGVPVYRLFNTKTGEHFYTVLAGEKQNCINSGWVDEGIAWYAPKKSNTPIYRVSNPNNGSEHHYTKSKSEKDWLVGLGWLDEGIAWYSDDAKTVPVYRHYHPIQKTGNHHYTTSKHESNHIVQYEGWKYEGVCWYAAKMP
ncbi:MAG: MBG domain-containing protein [Lachnospiraceae bacterium]|nr:MBG domain-containing protein [Lachnospiraceae bacterium]